MKLDELMFKMERAGFRLPKKKHSMQEAKVRVNPKTGTMMFEDDQDSLWSFDRRENHFDVLSRGGTYLRIALDGSVLGEKQSTLDYAH